ncbi:MAG: hypothetical protein HZB66_00935 [Candidatus Aenigmarchaeota archaeon]|nr:hypothetical protein [Candidatus Aenigmarchaeota archaeon]
MREVFLVATENRRKAEELLKKDEIVNRGSITMRSAASLEIKEDGYFIVVDAPEKAIKKAHELLKGIAVSYKNKEKVLGVIDEQENAAIEGFGNILG